MGEVIDLLNNSMWEMQQAKRILKESGNFLLSECVNQAQDDVDDIVQELVHINESTGSTL